METLIRFKSDVFTAMAIVDANTPYLIISLQWQRRAQATLEFSQAIVFKSHKVGKKAWSGKTSHKTDGSIVIIDWSFFFPSLSLACVADALNHGL